MPERKRRPPLSERKRKLREIRLRSIEKLRTFLRNHFGNRCNKEGCDETRSSKLQFAHLKPTKLSGRGRGRFERLLDVKNNLPCYTFLCRIHHLEFDAARWKEEFEREAVRRKAAEAAGKVEPGEEVPF